MLNELVDLSLVYGDQNAVDFSIQLASAILLALVVRLYYVRFAAPMGNLGSMGNILPLLAVITFLVIMVVKTSLALSLGLVGALSIVRFRAPIKDPMELTFIFMAIAIGLGCGAGKHILTSVVIMVVLGIDYVRIYFSQQELQSKTLLIDIPNPKGPETVQSILTLLEKITGSLRLSRVELDESRLTVVVDIDLLEKSKLDAIFSGINAIDPAAKTTFFDNKPIW
jgi:uncharacterized membrane protein YhiD involved in acid resistance